MCKRSFSEFAAPTVEFSVAKDCGAGTASTATKTEHGQRDAEPTVRELIAADGDLEQIKSSICGLTNDLHPLFDTKNICVCKHPNEVYCCLPHKVAELETSVEKPFDYIESTWSHPLQNLVLRSALQLATRMITHENTLPFWAGLIDLSEAPQEDKNHFYARARRLGADKEKQVLDFLVKAADNIRFHFKSFDLLPEDHPDGDDAHGFTGIWNVLPGDPLFEMDWEEVHCYAIHNGEPVIQKNAFPHVWLNVDDIEGHDMSNDNWLDSTISGVQASIVMSAAVIGHEFAHAMVLLTLGDVPEEPSFNGESLSDDNETGYSWEDFVFGGSLKVDEGSLSVMPSPNSNDGEANDEDSEASCGSGEEALPLTEYHFVDKQKWQRLLEQSFWDTDKKAFKKLWLRPGGIVHADTYLPEGDEVSASPSGKRICLDGVERGRQRIQTIRERGLHAIKARPDRRNRCVDKTEERRAVFHESRGKSYLDQAWSDCTKHYDGNVFLGGANPGAGQ
jgi:hypothetical protein